MKCYTYLIGWKEIDKWYYGVRYAKNCDPSELWVIYFTSSKLVKQTRVQYGNPDVVQIRKLFLSKEKARLWESKVLRRLYAPRKEKWLNQTDNKCIINTPETIERIAANKRNKTYEQIYTDPITLRKKRSDSNIRRGARSLQTKQKISQTRKQKYQEGTLRFNPKGLLDPISRQKGIETKKKNGIAAWNKGIPRDNATKEKIRNTLKLKRLEKLDGYHTINSK